MGFLDTLGDIASTVGDAASNAPSAAGDLVGGAAKGAGVGLGFANLTNPLHYLPGPAGVVGDIVSNPLSLSAAVPPAILGGLASAVGYGKDQIGGDPSTAAATPADPRPMDQKLAAFAKQQGLDPQVYLTRYNLAKSVSEITGKEFKEADVADTILTSILTDVDRTAAAKQQTYLEDQQAKSDQQFALAMQAQAQQFMQPYIQQIVQGGDAEAQSLRGLASQVPPSMRAVFENQATNATVGANRLAFAYAAQAGGVDQILASMSTQRMAAEQAQADIEYKRAQTEAQLALGDYYRSGGGSGGTQSFDDIKAEQEAQSGTK